MYRVTEYRSCNSRNCLSQLCFASPYVSIDTRELAPQMTAQIAIVIMSINLCCFVRSILGSSTSAKWSAIVSFGFSFIINLNKSILRAAFMRLPQQSHTTRFFAITRRGCGYAAACLIFRCVCPVCSG